MGLNVHIPDQGGSRYTVYARGLIKSKITMPGEGTFINFEGVVLLFYAYPRHRRAYIVREADDLHGHFIQRLPNVSKPVGVIYEARGRRVDILRNVFFNLEIIAGSEVYRYNALFWQKIGCLLDYKIKCRLLKTAPGTYKRSFAHKAVKANLALLCAACSAK